MERGGGIYLLSIVISLYYLGKKVEEANLTLADFEVHKRRLTGENSDLLRQLQVC